MSNNRTAACSPSLGWLTKVGNTAVISAIMTLGTFSTVSSAAPTIEWVNGNVTHIHAQLPKFTVAIIDNKAVRFCDPKSGADYAISADNLHFDLLKAALLNNKKVQVGAINFGYDAQSKDVKLCIDRVILTN